ncbi:PREDICTED: putative pentatricopeptide repeat-containing protein At3g47840 [Ipomoea nil]|uniref:putative pentatricopeptide repeat-containing protein At3g47840 n=1 Tax=Ipomoea nil TaxID=35883 RepID=UPI00090198A2|nr:PREDICTED: putative pentatricopeptide repeat-containing protein At3g47840 [Ipomoea nil]XP_019182875.1 PREDICTED: putative pentatricopeptide repeat-containing protein At3g47840 [Ipomoea nil]
MFGIKDVMIWCCASHPKMALAARRWGCIRQWHATSSIAYAESREILAAWNSKDQLTKESNGFDVLVINSQLKELINKGRLGDARQVFDKMPHRDEVSWTNMIAGYVNASNSFEALSLFYNIWVCPSLQLDPFILSLAVKACGISSNAKHGELIHGYSVRTGFVNSVFVGSSLLDMYMKLGKALEGCRLFDEMPTRNIVSWTALVTGLVHMGYNDDALQYFSEMWKDGIEYDSYAYAIALKACADLEHLNYGREIHAQVIKKGFGAGSYVANSLSTMYNKCGKLNYGLCLFERMNLRDVVSWTTIITTYVQMGQDQRAIQAFLQMRDSSTSPNEYTYAAIIAACANLARLDWGEQLHSNVLRVGFMAYPSVANSVMTMYSRCGLLDATSIVFSAMNKRDIVSWSTIIAGHAQAGRGEDAFILLSRMRREGTKPTEFALASVLSVCGTMAILDQGKQLHAHVLIIGLDRTALVQSALVNMYSKCGSITEASNIFHMAQSNDIVSWTAMINGFAEHGKSREAISLFEKIPEAGLKPDSIAFIGVLSACSHVGLVDLGFHYFNAMIRDYKLSPSKEHYGCMIDLLCRAGRLSDAEDMIKSMPFEKDDVVWSTLLRACRVHGDVECGRRATEQILKLDPDCAGAHITLANLYSSKGKWREAAELRKLMRSKGVIKEPGWSWIKLKDEMYAFVAGDKTHPKSEDIYIILELLTSKTDLTSQEIASLVEDKSKPAIVSACSN